MLHINEDLVAKYAPNVLDDNRITIDEIKEIIPKASADGIVTIPVSFFGYEQALAMARSEGAELFTDETTPNINSPEFTKAVQTLKDISSVSKDLYESAELDGAGTFKRIWYITLPSIRFQLLYTLVITIAGSFNVYGQPLMLTQQGTGGAAKITVLIMTIRNLAFGSGQSIAGMASAMAVMLGVFILIVSLIQFWLATKDD